MDDNESVTSYLSWVSEITTCEPIEKVLSKFNGNTKFNRKVLEIVTSMKNSIVKNGGTETSTEFYATTIQFLKVTEIDLESVEACIFILKHLIGQFISVPVLRATTGDLSRTLLNFLSGSHGKNEHIVKNCLFCLSKLLSVQPDSNWSLDNIKNLYRVLFSYTADARKEINKQARKSIMSLFRTKTKSNGPLAKAHPLNRETISVLRNAIQRQNTTNKKRDNSEVSLKSSPEDDRLSFSLTMLGSLLKSSMFPTDSLIEYLEILIQCLLSFQIVPIQCQILNQFGDLFSARVLLPEHVARSLSSLVAYLHQSGQRSSATSSPVPPGFIAAPWLSAALIGFEMLLCDETGSFVDSQTGQRVECRVAALAHASSFVRFCSDWLLSDVDELRQAAAATLERLCSGELRTREVKHEYLDSSCHDDSDSWLTKWVEPLCRLLTLAPSDSTALVVALDNVARLVKRSGGRCQGLVSTVFRTVSDLADIRDSLEAGSDEAVLLSSLARGTKNAHRDRTALSPGEIRLKQAIDALIGSLIRQCGLERVVQLPALSLDDLDSLSARTWLVPVIRSHGDHSCLDQFRTVLLPAIRALTDRIDALQATTGPDAVAMETDGEIPAAPSAALISLGTLRYQLWSCLVPLARHVVPGSLERVSTAQLSWQQHESTTLWGMLLDLIDPSAVASSNLETVVLSALRAVMTTAQDRDEACRVLCGPSLHPRLAQHLFSLATRNTGPMRAAAMATLSAYLPLFPTDSFLPQARFLLTRKLVGMDTASPSAEQLGCLELVSVLAPHLSVAGITEVAASLNPFLDGTGRHSNALQKRVYRFYSVVTASETDSSRDFTHGNGAAHLLDLFESVAGAVATESWKSRLRTLLHVFRGAGSSAAAAALTTRFMGEIVAALGLPNTKSRALAGLLLVEGVLAGAAAVSNDSSDRGGLGSAIARVLSTIMAAMRSPGNGQCRASLGRALVLVLSEPRLAREVDPSHVSGAIDLVAELLAAHEDGADRQLAQCAIDMLSGLLKHNVGGGGAIAVDDVGRCIGAASDRLRMKIRMPVKRVIKRALKLWDYDSVKRVMPTDIVPVVRNIHKAMNRAKRDTKSANKKDFESCATSFAGVSEAGTMKNPHIKNIAELLDDTDDEDDDDLKSRATASTVASKKSMKSNISRASELRKERKRKIDRANATLFLEENVDDIVDLSDPTSMVRNLRIADRATKRVTLVEDQLANKPADKVVDRRGFHFEAGRLVIGRSAEEEKKREANDDGEDENEHYKSEKERFQPAKKRMRREKVPGSEYKSFKKGVFGDMKRKDKPNPYAFIPLNSTDQCHSIMSRYEKETKKALKAARSMSKLRKKNSNK